MEIVRAAAAGRARVRRLALAHAISVAGSQAAEIAVVYAIYTRTHSGGWVVPHWPRRSAWAACSARSADWWPTASTAGR
ncbi:MAG TPA: hypothetical protein VGR90_03655 [Acidimicrobiales bacterium]|nr:hypothetical protein [Acidimicrobiales bacterium]